MMHPNRILPTLDDKEIIAEAMKHWDDDQGTANRANWEYDLNFYGGDHWDSTLKALREGSVGGARPCLVIDRLHVHSKNISNRIRQERPSISVSPVDDVGDQETADVFRGLLRHIENISMSTEQYAQAAETQVSAGVGYLRAYVSHGAVRGPNQHHDIYNSVVDDIFSVAVDPLSRNVYGLDAAWWAILTDVDRKQVETQYPDLPVSDWSTHKGVRNWRNDDEISLCEYFRIEKQASGRHTAAGAAGTAVAEKPTDPQSAAASCNLRGGTMTEPTYEADFLLEIPLNQRATFTWIANPGRELRTVVAAANGIGLRSIASGGTPETSCTFSWDE